MAKRKSSKRYKEALKVIEGKQQEMYSLKDAVDLFKKMPALKFNQSVDLNFHLNVDPKKSDQLVRGTVSLPHGTGKKVRVAVFCRGEQEKEAKAEGADYVGANELIDKVAAGFMDFDVAIAAPDIMKDLSRLGKVLGPRGLMPSPKVGTVTNNIANAIKDIKKGKIEFKVDKQSGINVAVGKIDFTPEQIIENAQKVIEAVRNAKPQTVKGDFIKSIHISTSMGPGLRLEV